MPPLFTRLPILVDNTQWTAILISGDFLVEDKQ
jgi:hypothetical protein